MNKIIIGLADKQIDTKPGFLLIDDGLVADTFLNDLNAPGVPPQPSQRQPPAKTYRKARDCVSVWRRRKDTLTVRNGKRSLARMLMRADTLDDLKGDRKTTPANKHSRSFDDLLLSPVLRNNPLQPDQLSRGPVIYRRPH
jgi:hypothetical protein